MLVDIHDVHDDEIAETVGIYREIWLSDYAPAMGLPQTQILDTWNSVAEEEECRAWLSVRERRNRVAVLVLGDLTAGHVAFGDCEENDAEARCDAELSGLFVRRYHRKRGYGTAMRCPACWMLETQECASTTSADPTRMPTIEGWAEWSPGR